MRFYDKKTGETWDEYDIANHFICGNHLMWDMNEFITEHTSTWRDLQTGERIDAWAENGEVDYREQPIWDNRKGDLR